MEFFYRKPFIVGFIGFYILLGCFFSFVFDPGETYISIFEVVPSMIASIWTYRAYRTHTNHIKSFWLLFFLGTFSYFLAQLTWGIYLLLLGTYPPQPGLPDLFYNLQTVLYVAALCYILFIGNKFLIGVRFVFDSMIVTIFLASVSWQYFIQPILENTQGNWLYQLTVAIYPISDLTIMVCLVMEYFTYKRIVTPKVLALLTIGLASFVFADTVYMYQIANNNFAIGSWNNLLWAAGLLLIGSSSILSVHSQQDQYAHMEEHSFRKVQRIVPYVCVGLLFIFMWNQIHQLDGMVVSALVMFLLVCVRQVILLMENDHLLGQLKIHLHHTHHMANHDDLTGLPNRRYFTDRLSKTIQDAEKESRSFAVMFMDLDKFKFINDTLGHGVGDVLIREVATRIQASMKASQLIARLGGDEFTVLIEGNCSNEQLEEISSQIINSVSFAFVIDHHEMRVGISIGVAVYPRDGNTVLTLMKHADAALYAAKEAGGKRMTYYTEDLSDKASEQARMEHMLG